MAEKNWKIRSVIFDLGGVLIENPVPELIRYCAERLKVDPSELSLAHERHAPDFQRGRIAETVYWDRVCREVGAALPIEASLWGDAFRVAYSENREIFSLADRLHRKEYRVGLLSDTEIPSMNYFLARRYGQFDFLVFSCREGTIKPEQRIYEIALARSGSAPGETVFIDDRLPNVEGARRAGIRGILFRSPGQLKEELAAMGVKNGGCNG